ncbi:hypothetical protein [Spiroplasma endosymbiont of Nebria brevicollis]|uniref:hypothetical protein n=1 Tax=Spiroplasma endosymbiont of Nebria brevicollis TaxID=3066284 RepID=UPI00313D4672
MTRNEFNTKYNEQDIKIDRDFDLSIDKYFNFSEINILEETIIDYKKIMNEIPQIVKDWLLG